MHDAGPLPTDALPRQPTPQNLRRWCTAYLAHILALPESGIDLYRGLGEYGLDSMDAVVMAGELEDHFQLEIDPAVFLRQDSLGALIDGIGQPG